MLLRDELLEKPIKNLRVETAVFFSELSLHPGIAVFQDELSVAKLAESRLQFWPNEKHKFPPKIPNGISNESYPVSFVQH